MSSRKPQKAVHSTDPGQSGWWLLLTFGGGVAGASIPYFATHSAAWTTGGGTIGAAVGATAAAIPQFRDWVSTRSRRRQIAESAGVATDITEQPLESLRVHSSDRDIAEFIPRDIQNQLIEHLNNDTPVLIEGPSMSGKTRLAIETIRSHWPEAPFWFPRDDSDIEKLLNSNQEPAPETVILLDDLDRFLSNQSLTLGLLNQWANNSCTIIATIMHSQYLKHSDRSNEKVTGWDVLNRFNTLTLTPSLSTKELDYVKLTSYANQLPQIETIGLGPLLGCAEAVRTAFADELEKHSWCGALIKAAADWRRIGLGPASREQLTSLSLFHENNAREVETVNWDEIWEQATKLINHTVSLLRQAGEDRWEVLDIIADEADWKINAAALSAYASFLHTERGDMDQAQDMYQRAINADPHDADILGNYAYFLNTVRGDMDQAQDMYQRAINADPHNAISFGNYAQILFVRSDDMKAIRLAEKAISLASDDERPLLAECHFYLFSHSPKHRKESGRALKILLADGVTTGDWSFEMNLERLRREEDPRLDLLEVVARTLEDGDMSRLNAFGEWRDL